MILLEKVSDFVGGSLYSMAFHDSLSSFMKQILIEWETEEGMLLFLFCECRDTPINTRSMTGLVNYRSKTLNTFDFVVRLVRMFKEAISLCVLQSFWVFICFVDISD